MKLLVAVSYVALSAAGVVTVQPWLNSSLPYEDRLLAFIAQLNDTQKYAMVQGDTEVSRSHDPSAHWYPMYLHRHHSLMTMAQA